MAAELLDSYTLRLAVPGDEEALSLLGSATFLETYSGALSGPDILAHCRRHHATSVYAAWLGDPAYRICVADLRTAPVGYAVLSPAELPASRPGDIELKRIYLLHRFQGVGLGRALMEWSVQQARTMGRLRLLLGVKAANAAALAFYTRHGFERVGERKFQVGAQVCDDLVLGRPL